MRRTHLRLLGAVTAITLTVAACGSDREGSEETTTVGGGDSSTTAAPAAETFGDLAWPCGPGDATGNTDSDTGVTAETVTIGIGDDRGFPTSPGLNKEMTEAVEAMVAKCNELGGINGRTVETEFFDAAILSIQQAATDACAADLFMLVGQGWALDSNQEEIRQGCGLPSIPTYTVSAAHAHAPLQFNGVPNPSDLTPALVAKQLAELFPEETKKAGTFAGNFSATQETRDKVIEAYGQLGWTFVGDKYEYNIQGESDYSPFVKQLKDAGIEALYYSGSCVPNYRAFREQTDVDGFNPIFLTDANFYESKCANQNTDGIMDNTYLRFAYIPWEERDINKATDDFLNVVEGADVEPSLLGMQGSSSFLMWATAVKECGADLTRQCVLDGIAEVHSWTAGGLHAETDPGANLPPDCSILLKLEGTEYVRVAPEEPGTYDCDESGTVAVDTPAVGAAKLDENRVSTLFSK